MATEEYDYTTHDEGYFPAFHWDGSEGSTNALAKLVGDTDGPYSADCDFFDIEQDNGDTVTAYPGDYIIPGVGFRWSVMDGDTFTEYFTKKGN